MSALPLGAWQVPNLWLRARWWLWADGLTPRPERVHSQIIKGNSRHIAKNQTSGRRTGTVPQHRTVTLGAHTRSKRNALSPEGTSTCSERSHPLQPRPPGPRAAVGRSQLRTEPQPAAPDGQRYEGKLCLSFCELRRTVPLRSEGENGFYRSPEQPEAHNGLVYHNTSIF